jgi:hypothetical protein
MALAEVTPLYETNFRDIPTALRRLADDIASGELDARAVTCVFDVDGVLHIHGLGATEFPDSALMLYRAAQAMTTKAYPKVDL